MPKALKMSDKYEKSEPIWQDVKLSVLDRHHAFLTFQDVDLGSCKTKKTGFVKELVHHVINGMSRQDKRWTQFMDRDEIHTCIRYKSLFKYICNK